MFKVLIALDGSSVSRHILTLAQQLFAGREMEITLLNVVPLAQEHKEVPVIIVEGFEADRQPAVALARHATPAHLVPRHVIEHSSSSSNGGNTATLYDSGLSQFTIDTHLHDYDLDADRLASLALLSTYARSLEQSGVSVIRRDSAIGEPADVILTTASRIGVDMIVVGSHGLTNPKRVLNGSVSAKVAIHATCPVLVVHPTAQQISSA